MNLRQQHKLSMYNVTSDFVTATDAVIINKMPQFNVVHDQLRATIQQIQAASEIQVKQTTAYIRQRDALRKPVEKLAKEITRRMSVFAINTGNVELEGLMKFPPSAFERMTDKEFVSRVNAITTIVEPLAGDASDYGVTEAMITQLRDNAETLAAYLPQPRKAVVARAYSTAEISALFREADRLLKLLDKYVAMLEFTEPAFYGIYSRSRIILDPATHKRSIAGTVKDEEGNPLQGVRISIDGNGSIFTNEAGSYHSANLPGGGHTVAFAFSGYHDHIANVTVTPRKRTLLNIVLQSL